MFGTAEKVTAPGWSIRNTLAWIAGTVIAALVVWLFHDELLLVLLATLLAVSLRGAAEGVAAYTPLSTRWALALIMLVAVLLVVGFGMWVGPQLVQQGQDLVKNLAQDVTDLKDRYGGTLWGHQLIQKATSGTPDAKSFAMPALRIAGSTVELVAGLLVLIVTMLYFAASPDLYVKGVLSLFPIPRRPRIREVMGKIAHVLRWWFMGQLIDMAAVGVLTTLGLWLVGVPLALALGVLAGILTFVPYFGAILAAVPALAVSAGHGWHTVLWTAIVFGLVHLVEGYIISPLVQDRMVHLPPALLILSMTFIGGLFGAMGIVLATPLAVVGLVVISELYVADTLRDPGGRDVTTRK